MRKRRFFILGLAILLLANVFCACKGEPDNSEDDVFTIDELHIHRFEELNQANEKIDSHADSADMSTLALDYSQSTTISGNTLGTSNAWYPRLRMVKDRYLLFFNTGKNGPAIAYVSSSDLKTWSKPTTLFAAAGITYASPDVLVSKSGDVLVFTSWRTSDYVNTTAGGGISMRRSKDNGVTWEPEEKIYLGTNWEPYPYQDPDTGEIQVYFTNTTAHRYTQTDGFNTSTGTAIIRSLDNGYTWNCSMSKPMQNEIVAQQATEVIEGIQYYTDQMPVAVKLHNGTIALALESRLDRNGNYKITMAYSDDNWATTLAPDEEGPADKATNIYNGTGPYIRQFDSGETVLSFTQKNDNARIGFFMSDGEARDFRRVYSASVRGTWCGLELLGTHTLAAVVGSPADGDTREINLMVLHLNHSINAPYTRIRVNGNNTDWTGDEAIFVGSKTDASASIRVAHDDENVYFLVERIDACITEEDAMTLRIATGEVQDNTFLEVVMNLSTVESLAYGRGSRITEELSADQVRCAISVKGSVDGNADDTGILYELAVPKALLGESFESEGRFYPVLYNADEGAAVHDTLDSASRSDVSTWLVFKLLKK